MVRGKWFITPHAVWRFRERVCGPIGYYDALEELIDVSKLARLIRQLPSGLALYRGPRPNRMRCFVNERVPKGMLPQLLTVVL